MIRVLLVCALCGGFCMTTPAQSIDAWIEQLAALKTLSNTIRQGYATMTGGLQHIGNFRAGEYQLHDGYFSSLDTVKTAVLDDPRVAALQRRLRELIGQLQSALGYWQRQPILSP